MDKKFHLRSGTSRQRSGMERVLRWVAAVTALLSLIFGIQRLVHAITEGSERVRQITELKQLTQLQVDNSEYAMAWESVNSALKLADAGGTLAKMFGGLDAQIRELRAAREDVAMTWVDDMHITGQQKFSDLA